MGCGSSKDEGKQEVPIAYDPKDIYFDRTGNLRYGHVVNDKEDELRRVIISDLAKIGNGGVAYVIDSSWMNCWLYFTHYDRNVSPNPGPCINEELVTYDKARSRWVAKEGLVMQLKDKPGNYCRVSKEVWDIFVECYPGSGPEIKAVFHESKTSAHDGLYDTSRWAVDQEFFTDKTVPEHEYDPPTDLPADLTDPAPPTQHDPAAAAIAAERHRMRMRQQMLAAVNMTDDSITEEQREEIRAFFGPGPKQEGMDKEGKLMVEKYTTPKKDRVKCKQT
ncbi:unnamed protein product, partial [Symbiodinium microadriaticum]